MPRLAAAAAIAATVLAVTQAATASGAVVEHQRPRPQLAAVSLESAASKAGSIARSIAMSMIGVAFAGASVVLAFRRDFRDAIAAFAVGVVAVLFATPAGVALLKATASSLFG